MPKFEVTIWVSETRYYEIEASDVDDALEAAKQGEPKFVKVYDINAEVTEV